MQEETFVGRPAYLSDNRTCSFQINQASYYQTMNNLMEEYPFGPSNLYSSPCLQLFNFKSNPEQNYLIHSDFSPTGKINKIVENVDETKSVFKLTCDRSTEVGVGDQSLGKNSRIFGLVTSEKEEVIGLKYCEGAAVAKLFQSDQDLVSAEIVSKRDLTGKFCCDIAFADWLDSFITCDSSGSIALTDWTSNKLVNVWSNAFSAQVVKIKLSISGKSVVNSFFIFCRNFAYHILLCRNDLHMSLK